MPIIRELQREGSSSRRICKMLETVGPMTQEQISMRAAVTISCACKCLKLLAEEGLVQRGGRMLNRNGTAIGMRPWVYVRTPKELPGLRAELPPPPSPQELCDIMNDIIRRRAG